MRIDTDACAGPREVPAACPTVPTIWEAGHYYQAKGPTKYSMAGWDILRRHAAPHDSRLLFVDDVHSIAEVSVMEAGLETIKFDPNPEPTHLAAESQMIEHAHSALRELERLPKRKRARKSGGVMRCSGFPLISRDGTPLCLFYDLGLTWYKRELGFRSAINIVPEFYEPEQRSLLRLVRKAMPDFRLEVYLHDVDGNWRKIELDDPV